MLGAGILLSIILLLSALVLIVSFPESPFEKKAIIGVALLAAAFFVLLLAITGFEALLELIKTESILEKHFPSELTNKNR